jgi:prepilin-type N-terminal cleavage/methylation domain-containing protein
MNYCPQPRTRTSAFTLVELLTVITIIAILMGLLFPAINIAKDQARKAEAKSAVSGIVAAVKQYYTEYGKYPLGQTNTQTDVIFGDSSGSNQVVFDILRNIGASQGVPNQYNPRGIVFFEGRTASDASTPKSGFAIQDGPNGVTKNSYVDPWGYQYRICIDGDYDNRITTGLPYADFQGDFAPRTGVCVFSVGKDGGVGNAKKGDSKYKSDGTASDDIISWQ